MVKKRNEQTQSPASRWGSEHVERKIKNSKQTNITEKIKRAAHTHRPIISESLSKQIDVITGEENFLENTKPSAQQLSRLISSAKMFSGGYFRSTAMICTDTCIMKSRCPLEIMDRAPYKVVPDEIVECPPEHQMMENKYKRYFKSYANTHGINEEDIGDDLFVSGLIGELAEGYVLENRVNTFLAHHGLMTEKAIAINNEGEMATNIEESPYLKIKREIKTNRKRIFKSLLLTPESVLSLSNPFSKSNDSISSGDLIARAKVALQSQGKSMKNGKIIDVEVINE